VQPLQLFDVQYFLAAVDGGSLLAGAKLAHVTAPAMTKALQRLESSLGVRLMSRTTRGTRLTADGERLVAPLRALLDQAALVREHAAGRSDRLRGEVRVLAMEAFSPFVLPRAIARVVREHPDLVTKTYESIPERMVELVGAGRADVAFTIGHPKSPAVRVIPLGVSPGVLVCGKSHPLRRRRRVGAADVARFPSVVPRFWGAEHLPSLDQFPDETWPRKIGATIELLRMGVALVEEGAFLGYFPEIAIRQELASGALVRLSSPAATPFSLVAMVPASGAKSAATALIEAVRGALRKR
jgi:DNA-binding transcriptional LysR family regulator